MKRAGWIVQFVLLGLLVAGCGDKQAAAGAISRQTGHTTTTRVRDCHL